MNDKSIQKKVEEINKKNYAQLMCTRAFVSIVKGKRKKVFKNL